MFKKLKVCIISEDFIPVWSGIGTYLISLLRHVPKDFEIHLITARRRICGRPIETEKEDNALLNEIGQSVSIHYVSEISNNFLDHFKFQVACGGFVPELCKNEKIDIVHSNFPLMSDIAVKLFRKLKIPSIATVHSTIEGQHESVKKAHVGFNCLQTSDMANLMLSYPLGILERLYTRRTSHFIAVSNFVKNEIIKYFNIPPEKIKVIYHGVDSSEDLNLTNNLKAQPLSSRRPVVLYTGRLAAGKGITCLVKAIPIVLKHVPNTCFHVIGGGKIGSYLPKLLENELLCRNSLIRGYVNHSTIGSYYQGCSVYVSPTLYDGLGLGILEAMSLGKPVIASAVGGIPEIIENKYNGLLVSPNNPKSLADAIVRLLSDPDLSELLGKNARNTVMAKFSMERMRNETYEYYRNVLKNA